MANETSQTIKIHWRQERGGVDKVIFLFALIFAAVGIWLVFDSMKEMMGSPTIAGFDEPTTIPEAPVETPTPLLFGPIDENFVLVVSKVGEYDPKWVRAIEQKFQGKIVEFSYDANDAPAKLKDLFKAGRPQVILTAGTGALAWMQSQEAQLPGLADVFRLALKTSVSDEDIKKKTPFFIEQRPSPESVFKSADYIFRDVPKRVVILHQSPLDDVYAESLYAEGLSQQFEVELKPIDSEKNFDGVLKTLTKEVGWFLVIESKMLSTQLSTDNFQRFQKGYKKPFATIGNVYENHGAVFSIVPDLISLAEGFPALVARLKAKEIPNASVPMEYPPNVALKVYTARGNALRLIRVESYANLLKKDYPLYQITVLN